MEKFVFYIKDRDGYFLHLCKSCGGYYAHSLKQDGSLYFDSYLLAMTFCMGYNSIAGLPESDKVSPILFPYNN